MKQFILLAAAAFFATNAKAQDDKRFVLGFAASPMVTWLSTPNDPTVASSGAAFGVGVGIFADYYFPDSKNYAVTLGANFSLNQGGTLTYAKGGRVVAKTELSNANFNGKFWDNGVKVSYRNQYLEIPIGIKLCSDIIDIGESSPGLRYYGNLPVFTLGIRTQSQGDISGTLGNTTVQDLKNENIGADMSVFNMSVGGGAGVEYFLDTRTSVYAALYYQHGLLDQTNNFARYNLVGTVVTEENEKSNAQLSGVSLRVGVNF